MGPFRYYATADDGDLDYYVLAGPAVPDVVRSFLVDDRRAGVSRRAGRLASA